MCVCMFVCVFTLRQFQTAYSDKFQMYSRGVFQEGDSIEVFQWVCVSLYTIPGGYSSGEIPVGVFQGYIPVLGERRGCSRGCSKIPGFQAVVVVVKINITFKHKSSSNCVFFFVKF